MNNKLISRRKPKPWRTRTLVFYSYACVLFGTAIESAVELKFSASTLFAIASASFLIFIRNCSTG